MIVIDATDLIIGRMCSQVAKKALLGETIHIVNCENSVVSGNRRNILDKYIQKTHRGEPFHGPFHPRMPDMFVKRIIRGMLPHKQPKGREALKKIKCYMGIPSELSTEKLQSLKGAEVKKLPNLKYIKLSDLCKQIGARI